jgi:hypothetical protein
VRGSIAWTNTILRENVSAAFLDRVADWIVQAGEVLVILRYLRAAGGKDFALCRSSAEFEGLVESVPTGTDIEVFRDPQLPIRVWSMMR